MANSYATVFNECLCPGSQMGQVITAATPLVTSLVIAAQSG